MPNELKVQCTCIGGCGSDEQTFSTILITGVVGNTVKPPKGDHRGDRACGLCREVGLF